MPLPANTTAEHPASTTGLLLLPHAPLRLTCSTLCAAYEHPLRSALEHLRSTDVHSVLDVVLPLRIQDASHRAVHFDYVARLLAGLYRLLDAIFDSDEIPRTGPCLVEKRVILLQFDPRAAYLPSHGLEHQQLDVLTSIPALVGSQRSWTNLFVVESEEGEQIYTQLRAVVVAKFGETPMQLLSSKPYRVKGGIVLNSTASRLLPEEVHANGHNQVVVSGDMSLSGISAKVLLTMAAFLLPPKLQLPSQRREIIIPEQSSNPMTTSTHNNTEDLEEMVKFLVAIGDFRLPSRVEEVLVGLDDSRDTSHRLAPGAILLRTAPLSDLEKLHDKGSPDSSAPLAYVQFGAELIEGQSTASERDIDKFTVQELEEDT